MNPTSVDTIRAVHAVHDVAHQIFGELVWLLLVLLLFELTKDLLKEFVGGVIWRMKSGYANMDIVRIDGESGRIVHLGLFRTSFIVYIFDKETGKKIVGGYSMSILNDELRRTKIQEPLPLVDIPENLRDAIR